METIDDDIAARATEFLENQHKAGKPVFLWVTFTDMHFRTHPKPESVGHGGRWQSPYHDVMIDHDKNVGAVLDKIDALGLADDTIVMYSTDNGPHMNSWPDAAMTPFRNEKNSVGRAFGIGPIVTYSTKLGKSHLDFSARWIHDFDVSKRVEGNGFNFTASLKF
jgi:arylsulfatase A-like enzyme